MSATIPDGLRTILDRTRALWSLTAAEARSRTCRRALGIGPDGGAEDAALAGFMFQRRPVAPRGANRVDVAEGREPGALAPAPPSPSGQWVSPFPVTSTTSNGAPPRRISPSTASVAGSRRSRRPSAGSVTTR